MITATPKTEWTSIAPPNGRCLAVMRSSLIQLFLRAGCRSCAGLRPLYQTDGIGRKAATRDIEQWQQAHRKK
jgi:hypothetical protein